MKLSFSVDECFLASAKRLARILGYEICNDGIRVNAVKCDRNGITLFDGVATVYYVNRHYFSRALGLLAENARRTSFEIFEDTHFTTLGVMIDASRGAVPKVSTVKELLDHLALMGYSMAMLYTEDTVELDGRPYFGYMRGRYTPISILLGFAISGPKSVIAPIPKKMIGGKITQSTPL